MKDAARVIDFFARNNICLVALTGGEPLLHPRLFDIMEELVRRNIVIAYLTTNNTLINDDIARHLGKAHINIVGVSVNLDFFCLPTGEIRKKEAARIRKATALLKKHSVNFYGGVILSQYTKDVRSVCETMRGLGFEKISFSYPQTEQKSSWKAFSDAPYLKFSKEEAKNIFNQLISMKREGRYPIYNTSDSLNEFLRFYSNEPLKYPCVCGDKMFYVDWDSNLFPCFTLSQKIGNILDGVEIKPCGPHHERCLQHAFKDPGLFYCALANIYEIKDLLFAGNLGGCWNRIRNKRTRDSVGALWEIARSPFI